MILIDPRLYTNHSVSKPTASKFGVRGSVCSSYQISALISSIVGITSKAAICMMILNRSPMLAGKLILKSGRKTIIYCAFTMAQKWFKPALKKRLSAKFVLSTSFDPDSSVSATASITS